MEYIDYKLWKAVALLAVIFFIAIWRGYKDY